VAILALFAWVTTALATVPADRFNGPGQGHSDVCVRLASPFALLRYADGTPTGFELSRRLVFENRDCALGRVRIDLHERIPTDRGPLVFHRGGLGYADAQNVKYGGLLTDDIDSRLPRPRRPGGGRGSAVRLADDVPYRLAIRSVPRRMKYKRPQDTPKHSNAGASFLHYGDPGADQGDREDVHYTYLTWSWVDVQGGGMVRALLAPNQVIRLCDVEPIAMKSWDHDGHRNGTVTARYVRAFVGRCPLHGWILWSHLYSHDKRPNTVFHAYRPRTPPPLEPRAGRDCPRPAHGRKPHVKTGAVRADRHGSLKMRGAVNPHGVPAYYSFVVRRRARYRTQTHLGKVGARRRPHAVFGRVRGLKPRTSYRYRLVALSVHGFGIGRARRARTGRHH